MRLEPFSDPYNRDPATTWQRLLSMSTPITYDAQLGMWLIAGYDNVRTVLADTGRFSNAATLAPIIPVTPAAGAMLAELTAPPVAVTADAPQHPRIRALLRGVLATTSTRAQQQWGDLIETRVDELVGELEQHEAADLMDFAVRLPLQIILELLGLPRTAAAHVRGWTDDFAALVWGNPSPEQQLAYAHSCVPLWRYCATAVTSRASAGDPGAGVIGDLLRYRDNDDTLLTIDEVAALALNIVGAGWETTAGALGSAFEHALVDPERWMRLASDDDYLHLHVEEALRHSPAIDGWLRLTTTEVTLDGATIPSGSRCLVMIGAANHDPAVYAEPHVFDPTRSNARQHLAFGVGPHYCIGAALARLEITTAVRTVARRLPDLALADGYRRQFKTSAALRQHTALPVHRRAAGRCPVAHPAASGDVQ